MPIEPAIPGNQRTSAEEVWSGGHACRQVMKVCCFYSLCEQHHASKRQHGRAVDDLAKASKFQFDTRSFRISRTSSSILMTISRETLEQSTYSTNNVRLYPRTAFGKGRHLASFSIIMCDYPPRFSLILYFLLCFYLYLRQFGSALDFVADHHPR